MNVVLILLALILGSCQSPSSSKREKAPDGTVLFYGEAMTMHYRVLVDGNLDSEHQDQIALLIDQVFYEVDTVCNKWNPHSELSKLNRQQADMLTPLSPLLARLFSETNIIVALSKGRFDPTIEPLQALWKSKLQKGEIPHESEIAAITPAIGWDKISFEGGVFRKRHPLTQLDFGGVAKGLCIDLMIERLHALGIKDAFVEWGGEIRASGHHPKGRPWTIFISRLGDDDPQHAIATLHLKEQAIATSGDYLQNWTVQNKEKDFKDREMITYFHIFDPATFKPLEAKSSSIAGTSVLAPSCALADGLATAAMMFPSPEEAAKWVEEIKILIPNTAFWITSRGQ